MPSNIFNKIFATAITLPDMSKFLAGMPPSNFPNNKKNWYEIKNFAASEIPEVWIYGDIGSSWYEESVSASEFAKLFGELKAAKINVRINSHGGSVTDAIMIYNCIKNHAAEVTVIIDGIAASAASLIAMAGDKLLMAENGLMMIHAPWGACAGNSSVMRSYADVLDTFARAMASGYSTKTGKSTEEVLTFLTDGKDHWFTAIEALENGWIDSISGASPEDTATAFEQEAAARYNSYPKASAKNASSMPAPFPVQGNSQARSREEILASEQKRREQIIISFARHQGIAGVSELEAQMLNDFNITAEAAGTRLLAHLASGASSVCGATQIRTIEDSRDIARAGMANGLLARMGIRNDDKKNHYRFESLFDLARDCLNNAGQRNNGMSRMDVIAAAFTHTSSDFGMVLINVSKNHDAGVSRGWRNISTVDKQG